MHEDEPLVSIIVPVLNEEEHIKKLVESVYAENYRPIELVLVDGGSRDRTLDLICKSMKELNNHLFKIRLFHEKDFGNVTNPGNARNIGVKMSEGNYLIFLDGDTFFLERDSVEKIKAMLDAHDFTKVKTKIIVDTDLESHLAKIYPRYHHCAYKRKVFDKVQFNPCLGYGEDKDFWCKLEKKLKLNLNVTCDTILGRHLPHTKKQYIRQTIWYAKTFPRFILVEVGEEQHPYFAEICDVLLACVAAIFPPVFVLLSINADIKSSEKNWSGLKFMIFNVIRRFLFVCAFVRASYRIDSLHLYTRLLLACLKNRFKCLRSQIRS